VTRALLGVDVGTGSARAGVFAPDGRLLASAKRSVTMWTEAGDVVEQSSEQVWGAVCDSVREAVAAAGVMATDVVGLGFDATCSLVALGPDGAPVTVSPSGDPARNIVVWMDHRAHAEAREINAGDHEVLRYVGGRISPEMQTPKLLWLSRHLPEAYARAGHFMDLGDFLTWRATGSLARSTCTVTCKWTYLAHEGRWDADYFRAIGLGDLADDGFRRLGTEVVGPGTALAQGLSAAAAAELGLRPGTAVGACLIDAHAGGVGTLGTSVTGTPSEATARLAYVFGTSACSMASTPAPAFVPGVWGPYFSAMIPGAVAQRGRAVGGRGGHRPPGADAPRRAGGRAPGRGGGPSLVEWLDREAARAVAGGASLPDLAGRVHVVPEFLGNRSPLADPDARAVIAGLGLERDLPSLVGLYVAGLLGIGYGLRQLLDRLREAVPWQRRSSRAGGRRAQPPRLPTPRGRYGRGGWRQPEAAEPVLLGAAMLGATAAASTRASRRHGRHVGRGSALRRTRTREAGTTADTERSRRCRTPPVPCAPLRAARA
jgi:FGGY-family pentulose kinase